MLSKNSRCIAAAAIAGLWTPSSAWAQADANAIANAEDAFGFQNGDESVGIYNSRSVRGFDLQSAGNYRFDGSYIVRNSGLPSVVIEANTVRIGYNTLNTILPGPSGVVDYRLRVPRAGDRGAVSLTLDDYGQPYIDFQIRNGGEDGRSAYAVGFNQVVDFRDAQGGKGGGDIVVAGIGHLTRGSMTARLFAAWYEYRKPQNFRIIPQADALPDRIERGRYLGPDWAKSEGRQRFAGFMVDSDTGAGTGLGITAFVADDSPERGYTQIFQDFRPDGSVNASEVIVPDQHSYSASGEMRGHVAWSAGRLSQRIDGVIRGRVSRARFGGSRSVDLGRVQFGEAPSAAARPAEGAPGSLQTAVDQYGAGLTYRATIPNLLRINLGALVTDYRKSFMAGPQLTSSSARPLLYNAGAAITVHQGVELYGSYTKGLEEAGVAPSSSANPGEILDAVIATQRELGVRITALPGMTAIFAGFDTRKPYAGVEAQTRRYGFLGQVRHRGIEASLSGSPVPGVSLVLGGVILDPQLNGAEVAAGRIGDRPVGVPRIKAIFGGDYRIAAVEGLSVDGAANYSGARPASSRPLASGRQLMVPALLTFDLGSRYSFKVAGRRLTFRAQIQNLFNAYEWEVDSSETLAYSEPRRVRFVLTANF